MLLFFFFFFTLAALTLRSVNKFAVLPSNSAAVLGWVNSAQSLGRVQPSVTPRAAALQAPLSMGILNKARILEWAAMPPPGDLPNPGIRLRSSALLADSLPFEPPGKPKNSGVGWPAPSPAGLPDPGIKPGSPSLQVDSLQAELPGKPLQKLYTSHLFAFGSMRNASVPGVYPYNTPPLTVLFTDQ